MNNRLSLHFLTFILVFLLSACSFNFSTYIGKASNAISQLFPTAASPTSTESSPTRASPSPTARSLTPTPSPESPYPTSSPPPLTHYTLIAELDYATHYLKVEEQVDYINNSGLPLPDLLMVVEPNRFPGSFSLKNLSWEGNQAITNYSLKENSLRIPLEEPLAVGGKVSLVLSYEVRLPQVVAPLGYTERQTNMADWYAFFPPFLAEGGWLVHPDAFVGEHLVYDMANFTVKLKLTSPTAPTGEPLIIAASSLPQIEGDRRIYQHGPARNFAWSVSHIYRQLSTMVGDITVLGYSFPYHAAADEAALQATAAALPVFSSLFSPYPHASLSVVEGEFLDGMEYDGLFFLSHAFYDYYPGNEQGNLTIIAAHETSHTWWFGLVGNDQAMEPWLDEALATYSELLFYENVYPSLVSWWWDNRITFHKPEGWVDSSIYSAAGFYPYRDAVYLRGVQFLHAVRSLLGEEEFFLFIKDYLSRFSYQHATGDDFFSVLAEHTTEDIQPLLDDYFANR